MSEVLRVFTARVTKFVAGYFNEPRRQAVLPVTINLMGKQTNGGLRETAPTVGGHTHSLSTGEIAFVVPSIRLGERYLAGADQRLRLTVELPNGTISVVAETKCYERLEKPNQPNCEYLIEAKIVEVSDPNRVAYDDFIRLGDQAAAGAGLINARPTAARARL